MQAKHGAESGEEVLGVGVEHAIEIESLVKAKLVLEILPARISLVGLAYGIGFSPRANG